jgi:hypothetical protein
MPLAPAYGCSAAGKFPPQRSSFSGSTASSADLPEVITDLGRDFSLHCNRTLYTAACLVKLFCRKVSGLSYNFRAGESAMSFGCK